MMKRFMALALILALAAACLPARAADVSQGLSPVYTLLSMDEGGNATLLGTAVLFENATTLVTTLWAADAPGTLMARGSGGLLAVEDVFQPTERSPLVLLTLAEPSPGQPVSLGKAEGTLSCRGVTKQGTAFALPVERVNTTPLDGADCLLFTGMAQALPGAVLLDASGALAGLAVATYTEGANRYVAYPAEHIAALLDGGAPAAEGLTWHTGLSAREEKGLVTVDWSGLTPAPAEGESAFTLIWADADNRYYSYASVAWEEGAYAFPAVPGHIYVVWLAQTAGEELDWAIDFPMDAGLVVEAAPQPDFDAWDFADQEAYLAWADAGASPGAAERLPALTPLTVQALEDEGIRLYLQATSTYRVEEEQEALMTLVLTAPDGSSYAETSGFLFMPELGEGDVWHGEVTGLFRDCAAYTGLAPGTYELCYYLDGRLATRVPLTVE